MLREYEQRNHAEVGPSMAAFPNESLNQTVDRFKLYLDRFTMAPWTLQRLCEIILAPTKQYVKLHKVHNPAASYVWDREWGTGLLHAILR